MEIEQPLQSGGREFLSNQCDTADKPAYTIYFRRDLSQASEDFAKQLFVMLGTLMTAASSFYFGAKTATSAQASALNAAKPPAGTPVLRGVTPNAMQRGAPTVLMEIAGDNLDLIKEVKAALGGQQVLAKDVTSNASTVKCTLVFDTAAPAGSWDIMVTDALASRRNCPARLRLHRTEHGGPTPW